MSNFHFNVTPDELEHEDRAYERILATPDTLVLELRIFDDVKSEPWIIGLDLDSGKVVALPWWYFREVDP